LKDPGGGNNVGRGRLLDKSEIFLLVLSPKAQEKNPFQ
jgi:hypothetical protein